MLGALSCHWYPLPSVSFSQLHGHVGHGHYVDMCLSRVELSGLMIWVALHHRQVDKGQTVHSVVVDRCTLVYTSSLWNSTARTGVAWPACVLPDTARFCQLAYGGDMLIYISKDTEIGFKRC